jgi:hypothetical protein
MREQVIHFINKKMPGGLPKKTARALLDIEDRAYVPVIRNPRRPRPTARRCSTFRAAAPSACSARSAWPPRPCCGMPACRPCCRRATCAAATRSGSGQFDKAEKMITDNRVLLHRVANTLNYLDIKTVVVSCGTCYDQLPATASTDLPGLPHHRHPRIPAGKGHQAAGGSRAPTCTTSPATTR